MDGNILSLPRDHAMISKRMLILHIHYLLRQLPYPIRWNSRAISECIEIFVEGEWLKNDDWKHYPSDLINDPNTPAAADVPILDEGYVKFPPSSQFASRQATFEKFIEGLFNYSKAIPQIACKDIMKEIPANLRPPTRNINTIRPTHGGKYLLYFIVHKMKTLRSCRCTRREWRRSTPSYCKCYSKG